ncbi:MAG: hypothetical protein NVSMB25_19070 [Thermoleophilaceae bacterium]
MADDPTTRAVEEHLRALDAELERLRQLDAALDARAKDTEAELAELQRLVARSSDILRRSEGG